MSFASFELTSDLLYTAMANEKLENERKRKYQDPPRPKLIRTQRLRRVWEEETEEVTKSTESESKEAEASESKKTKTDTKEAETRGSFLEKEATDTADPSDEGCTCGAAQDPTCPVCGGW